NSGSHLLTVSLSAHDLERTWTARVRGRTQRSGNRHARAYRNARVDQNKVPKNLLVNEPSLSTQRIGGSCGRREAYGSTCASVTLPGKRARKTSFIPPSSPL